MQVTVIKERNLSNLWFRVLEELIISEHTRVWTVEGEVGEEGDTDSRSHVGSGSFVGNKRLELEFAVLHVTHPGDRPLVPSLPPHIPPPTDMEYVNWYYTNYLIGDNVGENETYTYGSRIVPQLEPVIEKFSYGVGTNQCTIAVAKPWDIYLPDPPCLRTIDLRIYPNDEPRTLHMFLYFRSWAAWAGLPSNLAALRLLQEHLSECIGVLPGEIVATSKGLHLYEEEWTSAFNRTGEGHRTEELMKTLRRGSDG